MQKEKMTDSVRTSHMISDSDSFLLVVQALSPAPSKPAFLSSNIKPSPILMVAALIF